MYGRSLRTLVNSELLSQYQFLLNPGWWKVTVVQSSSVMSPTLLLSIAATCSATAPCKLLPHPRQIQATILLINYPTGRNKDLTQMDVRSQVEHSACAITAPLRSCTPYNPEVPEKRIMSLPLALASAPLTRLGRVLGFRRRKVYTHM